MKSGLTYPVIGLLAMMAGICFIPYHSSLPFSNIQSINIPDLILYFLLLILSLRVIFYEKVKIIRTPLDLPLFLFFLVGLSSLLIGKIVYSYDFFQAYLEFKVIIYYLVAIVVSNLVRNNRALNLLLGGHFLLAIVVSLALIVWSLTSPEQSSGTLQSVNRSPDEVYYRYQAQGGLLVFWAFCCLLCLLIVKQMRFWYLVGGAIVSLFLILLFSRHVWLSLFFSVVLTFFLTGRKHSTNLFKLTFLICLLAIFFVWAAILGVQPMKRYKELISYRLHSLKWIDHTGSYGLRTLENQYAIEKIKEHPVFGIGFTTPYRPQVYYPEDNIKHFIHNGYLWILLKLGLLGFIPFVWFSYIFVKRGLKNWDNLNGAFYKGVVLGSVSSYLGIALGNLAAPHFMQNWEVAALGLYFGTNEVIYRIEEANVTN